MDWISHPFIITNVCESAHTVITLPYCNIQYWYLHPFNPASPASPASPQVASLWDWGPSASLKDVDRDWNWCAPTQKGVEEDDDDYAVVLVVVVVVHGWMPMLPPSSHRQ